MSAFARAATAALAWVYDRPTTRFAPISGLMRFIPRPGRCSVTVAPCPNPEASTALGDLELERDYQGWTEGW